MAVTMSFRNKRPLVLTLWSLLCASHLNEAFLFSGTSARVVSRCRQSLPPEYTTDMHDDYPGSSQSNAASRVPHLNEDERFLRSPGIVLAALETGSPLQVHIGDISLARKAWKKRRRNKSPLLAPCSLHSIEPQRYLRQNILYLIKKFGTPRLSLAQLSQRYRFHFGTSTSLRNLAVKLLDGEAPSLDANASLLDVLLQIFPPENSQGIQFVQNAASKEWFLQTENWSLNKARKQAAAAAIVQFQAEERKDETDGPLIGFQHTGLVRTKGKTGDYQLQPLSAALRIPNKDSLAPVASGSTEENGIVAAYVWDFDPQGDAGAPLLILSLSPPPLQQQASQYNVPKLAYLNSSDGRQTPLRAMETLQVGDALSGTVVQLVKGAALIDVNVGSSEVVGLVLGRLPFKEAMTMKVKPKANRDETSFSEAIQSINLEDVEDTQNETSEDITHLFEFVNGVLQYQDPETGETHFLDVNDEEGDDESRGAHDVASSAESPKNAGSRYAARHWLHVGDQIQVFVKSVSRRTGQLLLSMKAQSHDHQSMIHESIQPKKAAVISKKLARLEQQVGGLHKLESLTGSECDGVVKATSSLGYLYIQPKASPSLPVGIARIEPNEGDVSGLREGDAVRIRIGGVDRKRGQLALEVLRKLAP